MRLRKTQSELIKLGIRFKYRESNGFGKIQIGNKRIQEQFLNVRTKSISIMVEEINMIDEDQVVAWIRNNQDRLK